MLKVMIVEDDLFIADMLEETLAARGYDVCGIARTVDEAVSLGESQRPDLAILDLRLADGGLGTDVAARLAPRGRLGILYATGNMGQIELSRTDGEACLVKPYRPDDLVRALEIVEQIVSTGHSSLPLPKGLHVLEPSPSGTAGRDSADHYSIATVQRLLRQQAALAGFGSFAYRETDLGKVLTQAARLCAEGLGVPFCKICRYRATENDLLVEAGVGWHKGVIGCVVSRADETSPQGRAFVSGEPVICPDLRTDASFKLPAFYAEHGIVSTVDVVITAENQPYGVLEIDSPVQQDYDQRDINFLTGYANILAGAVATSKRNNLLQSTIVQMKAMVADRDRLLVAKNIVIEERSHLLDEKNRLLMEKNVFAQELQHRVRNNLQLVYGMVDKQLQTVTDEAAKAGLSAIGRRVMTLAEVYEHLLGSGLSRTIDFGGYLSSLCASFKALEELEHPGIALTNHGEPVILDLDAVTALGLVIAELIANSYEHAFPNGTGTIDVTLVRREASGDATIVFADDGVGFKSNSNSKRHGLGLVNRLMQQLGGSAELDSIHGARWTLTFPVQAIAPADDNIHAAV